MDHFGVTLDRFGSYLVSCGLKVPKTLIFLMKNKESINVGVCMDMSVYVGMKMKKKMKKKMKMVMDMQVRMYIKINMPEAAHMSLSLTTASVWLRHLASGLRHRRLYATCYILYVISYMLYVISYTIHVI